MSGHAVKLSIVRAPALPRKAPTGRAARELPSDRYQTHPGYGVTPSQIVAIFREAESGFPCRQAELFDDIIETDCHLRNLFEQRSQAVAGKPWVVQAAGQGTDDQVGARVLQTALQRLPMIETWEHQLAFNRYGWGASEIDWDVVNIEGRDWIVPVWFANVPPHRFRIDERDQLRLLTKEHATKGEELEPGKWMITRRSGGRLARAALMRTAAWPALFKRNAGGDWYIYAQKFGMPLVLAKYLLTEPETDKDVALEVVKKIGDDGGAVIPKDIEVDVKNFGSADSSGTHGGLIGYCNREMSKLVNGSTLANDNSESGGASYALGDVHDSVRFEAIWYDAERVQEAFRVHVATPFAVFNGLSIVPPVLRFQIARDMSPESQLQMADTMVNKLRVRVSDAQLRHITGLRPPIDEADAVGAATAATDTSLDNKGGAGPDGGTELPDTPSREGTDQEAGVEASNHPAADRLLVGFLPFIKVRELRDVWLGLDERIPDDEMTCGEYQAKHGVAGQAGTGGDDA
jgi:phage gp29-like protein